MSDRLRVLVVDDEPPARDKLCLFLGRCAGVELVGEATDGLEAVQRIEARRPDLVFLDVRMPELDGFEVLEALAPEDRPHVVFVTAFDEFAVRAFEVRALDYLLKPYDEPRLRAAVERAREQIRRPTSSGSDSRGESGDVGGGTMQSLLTEVREREGPRDRLVVRDGDRLVLLRTKEILWAESDANYVKIRARTETFRIRKTLEGLLAELDPARFVRIHRFHVVQLDAIRELAPTSHGDHGVVLVDGTRLRLSRRYRDGLPEALRRSL